MKKTFALVLAIILMFSMTSEVFAASNSQKAEPVRLTGQFGEEETIRTRSPRGATTPFYLDKPVKDCKHAKVVLSIEQEDGDCSGFYYLYAMDFDENWEHIGTFKVPEKKVNGKEYSYEFDLDRRSNFVAVALWPEGQMNWCTGYYKYSVYVDPACITEYSDKIPEPIFEPLDVTEQYINTGYNSPGDWVNPYPADITEAFMSQFQ